MTTSEQSTLHPDRCEYEHPGFQKGKKYLLKTIKRRVHDHSTISNDARLLLHKKEAEIQNLKKEQEILKAEISDLKQQQHNSDTCLSAMVDRVKSVEWKQREFLMLLANAMKRTNSFQQMLQTYRQKKVLVGGGCGGGSGGGGEVFKKRRLASSGSFVDSFLAKGITQNADNSDQCYKPDMSATVRGEHGPDNRTGSVIGSGN